MVLAIDIGNSFIKFAFFKSGIPVHSGRIKHDCFNEIPVNDFHLRGCAVSSVVPEQTEKFKTFIKEKTGIEPVIISSASPFSLNIEYSTPHTLGIDRICGAEGALALIKGSAKSLNVNEAVISIDFGTATTINFLLPPNRFTGGIIAPGIKLMFQSLNKNTSQLPEVSFKDYEGVIGHSTNSSIASGVLNSALGLINEARAHLLGKEGIEKIYTCITGGNSGIILPYLNFEFTHEPLLVLYGINSVFANITAPKEGL